MSKIVFYLRLSFSLYVCVYIYIEKVHLFAIKTFPGCLYSHTKCDGLWWI